MTTITCRIPEALDAALSAQARRRGVPKAVVIREALSRASRREPTPAKPTGLELARALSGVLRGPADLSCNPAHLDALGA